MFVALATFDHSSWRISTEMRRQGESLSSTFARRSLSTALHFRKICFVSKKLTFPKDSLSPHARVIPRRVTAHVLQAAHTRLQTEARDTTIRSDLSSLRPSTRSGSRRLQKIEKCLEASSYSVLSLRSSRIGASRYPTIAEVRNAAVTRSRAGQSRTSAPRRREPGGDPALG